MEIKVIRLGIVPMGGDSEKREITWADICPGKLVVQVTDYMSKFCPT